MLKITQTLLSAWEYTYACREECHEEAYHDFLNALNLVPKEKTESMMNGLLFEDEVYKEASGIERYEHPTWELGIMKTASIIRGGQFQVKADRNITVAGHEFKIIGILDVLKAGTIYDIKFLNKGFHSADVVNKYLHSPQHPAYFYLVPEAYQFKYIVCDGTDIYTEPYTRKNTRHIGEIIEEFVSFLKDSDLWEIYQEKWSINNA